MLPLSYSYISLLIILLCLLYASRYVDSVEILSASSSTETTSSSSSPTWQKRTKRIYNPGKARGTNTVPLPSFANGDSIVPENTDDETSVSTGIGAPNIPLTINDEGKSVPVLTKAAFQHDDEEDLLPSMAEVFSLPERISRYCANPPFSGHEEANPPLPNYHLIHTTIMARHGDRSAIHQIPGIERINFHCNRPNEEEQVRLKKLFQPFQSTPQCVAEDNTYCDNITDPPLSNGKDEALGMWGRSRSIEEVCAPGHLTGKGWEQVLHIGLDMGEHYASLLTRNDMPWSIPLKIVTTNYGRTVLTAAGLGTGILASIQSSTVQNLSSSSSSHQHSHSSAIHEEFRHSQGISSVASRLVSSSSSSGTTASSPLLPGLQLPLPIHIVPRLIDVTLWPKNESVCERAKTMQTMDLSTMFAHAYPPDDIGVTIASNAVIPMDQVPLTEEIVDDLYTRFCHGYSIPCWEFDNTNINMDIEKNIADNNQRIGLMNQGSTGTVNELQIDPSTGTNRNSLRCLDHDQVSRLVASGDALYHHRFSNRATVLLTYPLLKNIATTLRRSAQHSKNSPRVMVRAAHDTGLSPLLATLGAHDGVYAWPGYASRVNFELWEIDPTSTSTDNKSLNPLRYLVRLVYNGIDFTSRLACAKQYPLPATENTDNKNKKENAMKKVEYTQWGCTLVDFENMIEMLLAPFPSWDMACNTPLGTEEAKYNRHTAVIVHSGSDSSSSSNVPILD